MSEDPLTVRAIGIDVESTVLLSDDMAALILRPEERSLDAHLVFSLKEAAYKAWSAMGGRFLDHHDVLVAVHGTRFDALVVADDVATSRVGSPSSATGPSPSSSWRADA